MHICDAQCPGTTLALILHIGKGADVLKVNQDFHYIACYCLTCTFTDLAHPCQTCQVVLLPHVQDYRGGPVGRPGTCLL